MNCKHCGHKIRKIRVGSKGGKQYSTTGYRHWTSCVSGHGVLPTSLKCWCGCMKPEPEEIKDNETQSNSKRE